MKKSASLNTIAGAVALALVASVGSVAHATTYNLDTSNGAPLSYSNQEDIFAGALTKGSTVDDTFSFTLSGTTSTETTAAVESSIKGDLTSYTLKLFKAGNTPSLLATANLSSGLDYTSNLAAGSYFLEVISAVKSVKNGFYTGSVSISAVPIPGALLLFGSSLIGLAGAGMRKRNNKTV